MEAPFDASSWDGISGPIFAGFGSAEGLWIAATLACVVVAIIGGWRHESHAYKSVEDGRH